MALRITIDPPTGLSALRTGATDALGPGVEQGANGSELPATVPAVNVGFDFTELLFVIGLAVLAGYLYDAATKEQEP